MGRTYSRLLFNIDVLLCCLAVAALQCSTTYQQLYYASMHPADLTRHTFNLYMHMHDGLPIIRLPRCLALGL